MNGNKPQAEDTIAEDIVIIFLFVYTLSGSLSLSTANYALLERLS